MNSTTTTNQAIITIVVSLFLALTGSANDINRTVEIRLASDPTKAFLGKQGQAIEVSSRTASKFRMHPGLTDANCVSFALNGATKSHFIRHQRGILLLHQRPDRPNTKGALLYNADATFKIIHVSSDSVRFAASNYPRSFITIRDDGFVIIRENPPLDKSTFVLK